MLCVANMLYVTVHQGTDDHQHQKAYCRCSLTFRRNICPCYFKIFLTMIFNGIIFHYEDTSIRITYGLLPAQLHYWIFTLFPIFHYSLRKKKKQTLNNLCVQSILYTCNVVSRRGIILPECISITIQILKTKSGFTFIPHGISFLNLSPHSVYL